MDIIAKQSAKLHIGCGRNILPEWINLDCVDLPGVDVVFDLDTCTENRFPFPDDSFDMILASHVLEHIKNPLPLLQELHRVARPGAKAVFAVPYGANDDAFEDPTHVRQYFLNSFGYFSQPFYWRADYGYRGDWQPEQIILAISAEQYAGELAEDIMADIMTLRNVVLEMTVELRAVKPVREAKRELQQAPEIRYRFV